MNNNLISLTIGLIIGIVLSAGISRIHYRNYHLIQEVNIGKFTFIDGKIYSLTEMQRDEGVKQAITR